MPLNTEYLQVVQYIKELPIIAEPSIFGFHKNADITKDTNASYEVSTSISTLLLNADGVRIDGFNFLLCVSSPNTYLINTL